MAGGVGGSHMAAANDPMGALMVQLTQFANETPGDIHLNQVANPSLKFQLLTSRIATSKSFRFMSQDSQM